VFLIDKLGNDRFSGLNLFLSFQQKLLFCRFPLPEAFWGYFRKGKNKSEGNNSSGGVCPGKLFSGSFDKKTSFWSLAELVFVKDSVFFPVFVPACLFPLKKSALIGSLEFWAPNSVELWSPFPRWLMCVGSSVSCVVLCLVPRFGWVSGGGLTALGFGSGSFCCFGSGSLFGLVSGRQTLLSKTQTQPVYHLNKGGHYGQFSKSFLGV
jgi:hypothetical protein